MSGFKRLLRIPRRDTVGIAEAIDEELRSHLEMKARDLVDEGCSEEEARREARRRFGNLEAIRRDCRQVQTLVAHERGRRHLLEELRCGRMRDSLFARCAAARGLP